MLTYRDAPHYSVPMRAELLRVSVRTCHRYVELGHAAIQVYLRDRARGVVPQMALLKRARR